MFQEKTDYGAGIQIQNNIDHRTNYDKNFCVESTR